MTLGKKLGLTVFIISQILVIAFSILYFICILLKFEIDITANSILAFEGTIFVATWGSKAASNFAPRQQGGQQ